MHIIILGTSLIMPSCRERERRVEAGRARERRRAVRIPAKRLSTDRAPGPATVGRGIGVVHDIRDLVAVVREGGMAGAERDIGARHHRAVVENPPVAADDCKCIPTLSRT